MISKNSENTVFCLQQHQTPACDNTEIFLGTKESATSKDYPVSAADAMEACAEDSSIYWVFF